MNAVVDLTMIDTDERVLDADALALFVSVHELCGIGVVHDREWWGVEAERLGTDWRGIYARRSEIIEELTTKAIERAARWAARERAA
jgi:hypothetical protein